MKEVIIPQYSFWSSFFQDRTFYMPGIYFQMIERLETNNKLWENVSNKYLLLKALVFIIFTFEIICNRKAIYLQSVIHPMYEPCSKIDLGW